MAPKKKPNRPRPPAGSRPAAGKSPGSRPAGSRPAGAPPAGAGAAGTKSTGPKAAGPKAGGPTAAGPRPATARPAGARPAAKPRDKGGPTRAERLAAAEAARRRKEARTRALVGAAVAAVVVLLVVTIVASRRSNDRTVSALQASGSCKYDTKADTDSGAGNNHIDGAVKYDTDPPAGGNHNPTAASPGVYTNESKPVDAQIVHALEHGYVAVWYRPDVDPATLEGLKGLAGRYDRDVVLAPRASLSRPVAATAWHRRLLCAPPDLQSLESFVKSYRNKGPEKVPH